MFTASLITMSLLIIAGCDKEETPEKRGVFVSTAPVTNITLDPGTNKMTVTTGGDADVVGAESVTERGFAWGPTSKPTTSDNKITAGSGTGNFKADVTGLTYAGIYYVRAYVISNGQTYYGNDVKFLASAPIEIIKNGDFTDATPADAPTIGQMAFWKTDEVDDGTVLGRYDDGPPHGWVAWTWHQAKGIYQTVGTVNNNAADFHISFSGRDDYDYWGSDPFVAVKLRVYDGNDPTSRVTVDSATVQFPSGGGWKDNQTVDFSWTADKAAQYAGKNLVVELDVLSAFEAFGYTGYDDWEVYMALDKVSVIQTLK